LYNPQPVPLTPGTRLGIYEIVSPIGAGGMGEVYRARDPRLGRDVAIKVLPEAFSGDAQRLARFQREAQALAALNHPNIAGIYGLEESGTMRFLVLELVPGETLAELLRARGSLPLQEALDICRQLAGALETAHEKGIVHRDLKPANVKLTPDGKVKVLDFGLAKAMASDSSETDPALSPTLSLASTRAGVILGTAAYMSPEQARGKAIDRRTDVWAFGCVLFELLTGRQVFAGETVSDAVAVILTREPDWQALPPTTPHRVRELLRRCLNKDASHRLRDLGDARIEIEEILAAPDSGSYSPAVALPSAPAPSAGPASFWARPVAIGRAAAATAIVALAVALLLWFGLRVGSQTPAPLIRVSLPAPPGELIARLNHPTLAISPDSRAITFVAGKGNSSQLYLRSLEQNDATPIPGSQNARSPFFSPDGEWIGFLAEGRLKKVSVRGGNAVSLCDALPEDSRGASWGNDGWIYFAPTFTSGISRVSQSGGKPEQVTHPDEKRGERTHRWPETLPGSKGLLFTIGSIKSPDYYFDAKVAVQSLATGQVKVLVDGGTNPRYLKSGHLLYATASGILAAPFDLGKLEITGPPVLLPEQVQAATDTGAVNYAISSDGVLAYLLGEAPNTEHSLQWMDLSGKVELLGAPKRNYFEPVLSPDGKRVAVTIPGSRNDDIWVLDIARNTLTRLTFGPGAAFGPLWTPDGTRLVYSSERDNKPGLFWKPADGSGAEERLLSASTQPNPDSFSPDGKLLMFTLASPDRQGDILLLPLQGDRRPRDFLATPFNEYGATLSPDGRWVAYISNEAGIEALYVQPFPGPGGKWQISSGAAGGNPQWSRDGKQLFFRIDQGVAKVDVTTSPSFSVSAPRPLFATTFGGLRPFVRMLFSLSPDARRILTIQGSERDAGATQINLVFGWTDEIKRRAATASK
jgi:serine/threonine-protein kinase